MKLIALVLSLSVVASAGCAKNQPSDESKATAADSVGLLFEHEGVRVYRFGDGGRYHYYAVPRNGVFASAFSEWTETRSCGKNCTQTVVVLDEVPTVGVR